MMRLLKPTSISRLTVGRELAQIVGISDIADSVGHRVVTILTPDSPEVMIGLEDGTTVGDDRAYMVPQFPQASSVTFHLAADQQLYAMAATAVAHITVIVEHLSNGG